MTHGHEVLHMMEGNSYTEETLLQAIEEKFGKDERFCTCHASDLTAKELIDFLRERGKFCDAGNQQFTVNIDRVCKN